MTHSRRHTPLDRFIIESDKILRTLKAKPTAHVRPSPSHSIEECELNAQEQRHAAGLMRVNHTGEVCAQALYQGQALTAKLDDVRSTMEHAAAEEVDHLAWCDERLRELNSHNSHLNPLWYGLSFSIGAFAGAVGDKISLGFVAATEEQVCTHLQSHLTQLPQADRKSRAIVTQMLEDEARHARSALDAGGISLPKPIRLGMSLLAKVMTKTTYHI